MRGTEEGDPANKKDACGEAGKFVVESPPAVADAILITSKGNLEN